MRAAKLSSHTLVAYAGAEALVDKTDVAYPLVPNVGIVFSGIDLAARATIDEWVKGSLSV